MSDSFTDRINIGPVIPNTGPSSRGGAVTLGSTGTAWGQQSPAALIGLIQEDLVKLNSQINALYSVLKQDVWALFPKFIGANNYNHQAGMVPDAGFYATDLATGEPLFFKADGTFAAVGGAAGS